MNRYALAAESGHVRAEFAKVWDRTKVLDRATQMASEAIAAALRGEHVELPGHPAPNAEATEWHAYFIQRATVVLETEGVV